MADHSHIEWTDATWNPITGCSIVSPGCIHCYAMRLAAGRLKHHPSRQGLTQESKAGPVWTGEVRFNDEQLAWPLKWRKGRKIFVCAHGDLFAEGVPDEWIDQVFAVMALTPQHTFQVLTKRPARMRDYLTSDLVAPNATRTQARICKAIDGLAPIRTDASNAAKDRVISVAASGRQTWPLPNVWLGTSVEDQKRADERIPDLLATPAAVHFVSAEPLLGLIELTPWLHDSDCQVLAEGVCTCSQPREDHLDWVIAGGESGVCARPMHPNWARSLRDQCAEAGVPFHFKQWGAWRHMPERAHFKDEYAEPWQRVESQVEGVRPALMFNIGKKAAGRLLDGVEHNGFPKSAEGLAAAPGAAAQAALESH